AVKNISVLRTGGAQVIGIKITGFVNHFGMRDDDLIAFMTRYFHLYPTHQVLAKVDHLFALWGGKYFYGLKSFVLAHRLAVGGYQGVFGKILDGYATPVFIIKIGDRPIFLLHIVVDGGAIIDLGKTHRPGGRLP